MIETLEAQVTRTAKSRLSEVDFHNLPFGRVFADHMLIAKYADGRWGSMTIEPFRDLPMSPASSMIHYGQSIFEGLKAYRASNGDVLVFRPDKNWERLNNSAARMCMPSVPREIFIDGLRQLLDLDRAWVPSVENCSLYIRPFLFATDAFLGVKPSETYSFMIITSPVGPYYVKPLHLKIETKYTRAAVGGVGFTKAAGNYGGALYPAKLAQQQGVDQLIWTDAREHKYIEEAGTMNMFVVIDDVLLTPPLTSTILPGVTRDSFLTLAREEGFAVEERPISAEEVMKAAEEGRIDGMFGAGTAATIAQVEKLSWEDKTYVLPTISERKISNTIGSKLLSIKKGEEPDTRGWIMRV